MLLGNMVSVGNAMASRPAYVFISRPDLFFLEQLFISCHGSDESLQCKLEDRWMNDSFPRELRQRPDE